MQKRIIIVQKKGLNKIDNLYNPLFKLLFKNSHLLVISYKIIIFYFLSVDLIISMIFKYGTRKFVIMN